MIEIIVHFKKKFSVLQIRPYLLEILLNMKLQLTQTLEDHPPATEAELFAPIQCQS